MNNRYNDSNINLRLIKLEEFYLSLSSHLEGERVLRKEGDEKCKELYDLIAKQIIEIKDNQSNESLTKRFDSFKNQFLNIIESKIDGKIIENKDRLEAQYIKNKINEDSYNKKIESEFNNYKSELNNIDKRLELIENNYNKKLKGISDKISEIYANQKNLKIFNEDILNKINDINKKINLLQQDKKSDININKKIKNIENKLEDLVLINKENEEKKNIDLDSINNNLACLKSEFGSLSDNFFREIEDIKNNINNQNILKNKEINKFEQHLLGEYENFTKFVTDILNQNIDKIKSMNEYLNSDVEIVKNKNKYLEETLLKLREDIYDTLKKNSKYILDKMHSLFNLEFNKKNNFANDKNENENNYENYENKEESDCI